jgi:undecaprenyl-diphosphatase
MTIFDFLRLFDYLAFLNFNGLANLNPVLDWLVIFFAVYTSHLLVAGIVWFWLRAKHLVAARLRILLAILSFVVARFVVVEGIRFLYPRSRPFINHEDTIQLFPKENQSSFPSGHAASFAAIGMSVYFYNKRLGLGLLVIAMLVGIARVIAGVHYPSDIIAGFFVGVVTAIVIERLLAYRVGRHTEKISAVFDRLSPFTKSR